MKILLAFLLMSIFLMGCEKTSEFNNYRQVGRPYIGVFEGLYKRSDTGVLRLRIKDEVSQYNYSCLIQESQNNRKIIKSIKKEYIVFEGYMDWQTGECFIYTLYEKISPSKVEVYK